MVKIPNANIDIHIHPFLGRNTVVDVVNAMNEAEIDAVALEYLNASVYPAVLKEALKHYPKAIASKTGVMLPNSRCIFNAREYGTKENLHILTVGYSLDSATPQTEIREIIDKGLEHNALVVLDHPFADNGRTKTAGHISQTLEDEVERLCREYAGEIALEWNGYCNPGVRRVLLTALNYLGIQTSYHDVNRKVEELSAKLQKQGYNLPVLADTDLHARTKQHLRAMGTARFVIDIEGESPSEVLQSIKENVFGGSYRNVKRYASLPHLLSAFCFPILMPYIFKKPRS